MKAYVVESAAIRSNAQKLNAGTAALWAVVKGDGYGLGVAEFSRELLAAGVTHFAVTEPREAEAVRSQSAEAQILMLRPTCDLAELEQLLRLRVICTISTIENAQLLSALACSMQQVADVHLKIDTGMGRYGFHTDELSTIRLVYEMQNLNVCGTYTHFHSAFCSEEATRAQFRAFTGLLGAMQAEGLNPGMRHCCNSAAALLYPEMHLDAVRVGSALLGRVGVKDPLGLTRVGYAVAAVDELHSVKKGGSTGYGAGWVAKRDTTLAIIPVGNDHGFAVEKGNDLYRPRDCIRNAIHWLKGILKHRTLTVEIKGNRYPVCGHVGMLHIAVDVTGSDVHAGDLVRLEINPLLQKHLPVEYR